MTTFIRRVASLLLACSLCMLHTNIAMAGVDDCLKAALNTANPDELKKAATFAAHHPACLQNLAPPTLVPYVALSGSLDTANQSGALNKLGLGFNNYQQCANKVNPGKASLKQLAPILKPVCSTLNMNCQMFEGQAAEEVNAQLSSEVPLLSLLPCSCAAATSGLGVEKIAELVKDTKQCGATFEQVGEALGDAAMGVYDIGGDAVGYGEDAASAAIKLGESIVKDIGSVGCAVSKLWGGCKGAPPTYKTTATAICKVHQSTWWAASKTSGPDDFFVQCNDGMYCWAHPGESLRCEQRRTPAQRNGDIAKMKQWCPQREQELEGGYQMQCHDGLCKIAVTNVASQYGAACMKLAVQSEAKSLPTDLPGAEMKDWLGMDESNFISKFDQLIKESIQRDPKTSAVQLLATYECRTFLGRLEQSLCKWNSGFQVCKKLVDTGKIQKCFLAGGGEYPAPVKTSPKKNISLRSLDRNPATSDQAPAANIQRPSARIADAAPGEESPIVVSDGFLANAAQKGCRPVLGRRDRLQCDNQAGYDECVRAVNKNYLRQCRNALNGEMFPAAERQR